MVVRLHWQIYCNIEVIMEECAQNSMEGMKMCKEIYRKDGCPVNVAPHIVVKLTEVSDVLTAPIIRVISCSRTQSSSYSPP
jgi:hypothetical protein